MGSPGRGWRIVVAVAAAAGMFRAAPARATGTEVASRALPALLVVDETNLVRLPAGLAYYPRRLLLQAGRGAGTVYNPVTGEYESEVSLAETGPFGLVTAGGSSRFGYLVQGGLHAGLFRAGSFGLSLAYTDNLTEREDLRFQYRENNVEDEYLRYSKNTIRRTQVRLGAGALAVSGGGRLFEVGAGASWLDVEQETRARDLTRGEEAWGWAVSGVLAADILVRTLDPGSGLQFAAGYTYENLDPDYANHVLPAKDRTQTASADLAWRQPVEGLDDFVVGGSGRWFMADGSRFQGDTYYVNQRQSVDKRLLLSLYASLEKEITHDLVLRGGVAGWADRRDTETVDVRFDTDSDVVEYSVDGNHDTRWQLTSPSIRLGLGWTWKGFTADVLVDQEIDLSTLLASWALSYPF